MRRIQRKGSLSFVTAVFIAVAVSFASADIPDEIGTNEAAFLKIDAASRPTAMGGAFVGVANDVNSVFWNPAGLTQMEKREFTAMYNSWFADINYASGAYSQPMGDNAAVAVSLIWLQSEIERRLDDTEEPDSVFNAYSFAAGLSGSYALIPDVFSLGGTIKYIGQDFDVEESDGVAADLGGLIQMGTLTLGASAQNLKLHMSTDDAGLPLSIRAGGAYRFTKDSIIAGEFSKLGDADLSYHIGLEKWIRDILAIRVGYVIGSGDNPREGLSAGLGLRAYGTKPLEAVSFQFDYAYVPEGDGLGDTHRISMMTRF
ncbi:PorV/PorQ family protein [Candidatus Poribacteria bacterium]